MNNPDQKNEEASGQNKEYLIIVNAREKIWLGKDINFEQVVTLAFGILENNGNTAYTVTYKRGVDKKPEGSMVIGDSVHIKNKMIFNVTKTNKS